MSPTVSHKSSNGFSYEPTYRNAFVPVQFRTCGKSEILASKAANVLDLLITSKGVETHRMERSSNEGFDYSLMEGESGKDKQAENDRFYEAIRPYLTKCFQSCTPPSIDALHNFALSLAVQTALPRQERRTDIVKDIRTVKFRTRCCNLVMCLWYACCNTPYLLKEQRTKDSFRPFVCGVIYALKRGISLHDGSVLLPRCEQLHAILPALKETKGNRILKSLQSSSHRGKLTTHILVHIEMQSSALESSALESSALEMQSSALEMQSSAPTKHTQQTVTHVSLFAHVPFSTNS